MKAILGLVFFALYGIVHAKDEVFRDIVRFRGLPGENDTGSPKTFYIRNNLKGDIVFRESGNVTVEVFISGKKEDRERFKVHYGMLNNNTVVDLQVFLEPEQLNWPMIGGIAGAGFLVLIVLIVLVCVWQKRRKKKKQEEDEDTKNKGKNVRDIMKRFMSSKRSRKSAKLTASKNEKENVKLQSIRQGAVNVKDRANTFEEQKAETSTPESSPAKKVEPQGRKPKTVMGIAILLFSFFTVAMAVSSMTPQARIVVYVPSKLVKSGSKMFFNEKYHGRLVAMRGWKGDVKVFEQFAVPQASSVVPTLDTCSSSCTYGCDTNTKKCICFRGYKMEGNECKDIDECATGHNNCYDKSTCTNTNGSYHCTCPDELWGDGVTCKVCTITKPCPENYYESSKCTRTRDRVCTACGQKCAKSTYQKYGCGLTFDRKCVDISNPLTKDETAENITDIIATRDGTKVVPLSKMLIENRLHVRSTNATFIAKKGVTEKFTLHRHPGQSGFEIDVEVSNIHLTPKYKDYDGGRGSNNPVIKTKNGYNEIKTSYCRYPAPINYELRHKLHRQRQTTVNSATCEQANINLCPEHADVGELYYYRSLNDACKLALTSRVCLSANCVLPQPNDKLYCTHYVTMLNNVFAMDEDSFEDQQLYEFDSFDCQNAYFSCETCRKNNCSKCVEDSTNKALSCSCCYKGCFSPCETFYERRCSAKRVPKKCAKGDVSEFQLTPKYSNNLKLQFNCYLEHDPPNSLYTVKYRVRYQNGTAYTSNWIHKTLKPTEESLLTKDTNILDSLEIHHNSHFVKQYFLKAERSSSSASFKYSVAEMGKEGAPIANDATTKIIQPISPFLIQVGDGSWKDRGTCRKLSSWASIFRSDFTNFKSLRVKHLEAMGYEVSSPDSPPKMTVRISDQKSVLKYIFNNSTIVNDKTFHNSIERGNSSWVIKLKGRLTHCPSVIGLTLVDELDEVKVLESDLLILCPEEEFEMKLEVPRQGLEDRERLFSVFITDSQQEYKLQVAIVDQTARKTDEFKEKEKDTRKEPWIILMPLFATTGGVLFALVAMMIYAQKTAEKAPQMELASASGWVWVKDGKKHKKDKNRLKRRHLILVVFVVVVRLVYSFVFTFSMALAILTLLHADNMKIIDDYRGFVQRKIDESKSIALRMDQFREKEIKSAFDQSADVQRACDFYLGIQLKWLQYNLSCTLQENHVKMFNKISESIIEKVTAEVDILEKKVKKKVKKFSEKTKHEMSNLRHQVENYGRRVYDNGWFALPKLAYRIVSGRKRRALVEGALGEPLQITGNNALKQDQSNSQITKALQVLSRAKRSFSDNNFIGFLDFVGALDKKRVADLERSIHEKLNALKDSFNDFKQVMASGTPPALPSSTAFLCPVRYLTEKAKEGLEKGLKTGLKEVCEKSEGGIQKDAHCLNLNVSNFCSAQDIDDIFENTKLDSSSQRVYFEKQSGVDSTQNVSAANRSSVIKGVQSNSHYNVEKGDNIEEQIDTEKEKTLKKQGKLKNLGSIYDAEFFQILKKTVLYIFVIIDVLLFVYRCMKTYQIVIKLLYGFESIVEHDMYEFHEPTTKEKIADLLRRSVDILAKVFTKIIQGIKNTQKRILRTNILPMIIIVAIGGAMFYLIIVITFNVMNVTVIEELGGYHIVSSRLDADLDFTNIAIADNIKFLEKHDMKIYKESIGNTLEEYKAVAKDFSEAEKLRFQEFNDRFCSIKNRSTCVPFKPDFPKVSFSSCIIPRFKKRKFEEYNGTQYRYKLKYESKKYVDAVRDIFLDTLYFIIGVIMAFGLIAVCTMIMFFFLKSRDMIRTRYIHVYPTLPPEVLREYGLDDIEDESSLEEKGDTKDGTVPRKLKIPEKFANDNTDC